MVTGGTSGLGSAIAQELHNSGLSVVSTFCKNANRANDFTEKTGIPSKSWDVADFDQCLESVKEIENEYGPISILVNNAGITKDRLLHKMSISEWKEVLDTNLSSVFNMSRAVFPTMMENGFGRIVNISSVNALTGQFGQTNYSASKAGIIGFTKSIALEGARYGITANVVAPGYCETEMMQNIPDDILKKMIDKIPLRRLGAPREVAKAVRFLISDDSSYITGSTLSINGGLNLH